MKEIRMAEIKPKANEAATSRISFPQRVYNVLKVCEDNHQEHVVSWMNDGTAFKVHDTEEFERELLPKYFNTQKYASFTRALCSHGFGCVRTGRQTGIYSHPKFNRNDPEAVCLMKRVKKASYSKAWKRREPSSLIATPYSGSFHHHHLASISSERMDDPKLMIENFVPIIDGHAASIPSCYMRKRSDQLTGDQQERHEQIAQNYGLVCLGDNETPIPVSPNFNLYAELQEVLDNNDDFEPITWSSEHIALLLGAMCGDE
ncbi:unnamed protein product [Cylindrotheca closterium]|uniref:HSF-type DNA-binding domain-containing protein n=1 Tax=Cylindrotheca closterium TaxID=2856 RepID=A0AAD2JLM8_9STRA|nr:unnamed protein product [Cylindrotheca closterium]